MKQKINIRIQRIFNLELPANRGFAMLFTVLIMSLILSIALSISNISFKQTILSNLAKDSQIAFYQADTAIECGLYEYSQSRFEAGTTLSAAPATVVCGNDTLPLDSTVSYQDYFVYRKTGGGTCYAITFDRTQIVNGEGNTILEGRGYNVCNGSPRQVERALRVTF